jgi:hypothetical protein
LRQATETGLPNLRSGEQVARMAVGRHHQPSAGLSFFGLSAFLTAPLGAQLVYLRIDDLSVFVCALTTYLRRKDQNVQSHHKYKCLR